MELPLKYILQIIYSYKAIYKSTESVMYEVDYEQQCIKQCMNNVYGRNASSTIFSGSTWACEKWAISLLPHTWRANNLKKHFLIHTGEKPHKCTQCNYSANHTSHLRKHIMKHTGVKPHQCNECDYASTHSGNLKKHKRIHSRKKPHRCTMCEFCSIQAVHLKDHITFYGAWQASRLFECALNESARS